MYELKYSLLFIGYTAVLQINLYVNTTNYGKSGLRLKVSLATI